MHVPHARLASTALNQDSPHQMDTATRVTFARAVLMYLIQRTGPREKFALTEASASWAQVVQKTALLEPTTRTKRVSRKTTAKPVTQGNTAQVQRAAHQLEIAQQGITVRQEAL